MTVKKIISVSLRGVASGRGAEDAGGVSQWQIKAQNFSGRDGIASYGPPFRVLNKERRRKKFAFARYFF